jgi:hypothetical protein
MSAAGDALNLRHHLLLIKPSTHSPGRLDSAALSNWITRVLDFGGAFQAKRGSGRPTVPLINDDQQTSLRKRL